MTIFRKNNSEPETSSKGKWEIGKFALKRINPPLETKNLETGPFPDGDGEACDTALALDDEQRVRILSPGMLVFKRFIRNKLAIVGSIILLTMFLFAFLGGWLMPYGQKQVFTEYVDMSKDYAGVTVNTEYRYVESESGIFPSVARAEFISAALNSRAVFTADGVEYQLQKLGENYFIVYGLIQVDSTAGIPASELVTVTKKNLNLTFHRKIVAFASYNVFDYANADSEKSFEFQFLTQMAMLAPAAGEPSPLDTAQSAPGLPAPDFSKITVKQDNTREYTVNGSKYTLTIGDDSATVSKGDIAEYAAVSKYIVQAIMPDVFLTIRFKDELKTAIENEEKNFSFTDDTGKTTKFIINRDNLRWTIKTDEQTDVIADYDKPNAEHWVGTDGNGMDLLTRLMYGGRVSLLIGFIVVLIETFIGVVLGGLSGFFGRWVDDLLMRLVDIFNCIPSLPIIIIIGAMMDQLRVDPTERIFLLMLILGILGWPGIARLTRGQILSLREQEFMVATEASGLSVYRRIFKHLIPNVIPQLIVVSTMALGDVILMESTLSFLGLGVKFPFASWGNIINDVSNVYVMTNYWFVWIPAGFLILITVLAFNFIGDGLRDAFDPKMKR
jgi:peptide/nickel transport system permease protein